MTVRVELLIIGNEILSGQIQDTNSQWLAKKLLALGLAIESISIIHDDVNVIAKAIQASCTRETHLLVTSGGLGPTYDDRTAEGLALAARTSLKLNPTALKMIKERYKALDSQGYVASSKITSSRKKMALLPIGTQPLHNSVGAAPGIEYKLGETLIFCLPGVPEELKAIFLEEVQPRIASLSNNIIMKKTLTVPVLDESILAPILNQIMGEVEGAYLKSTPRPYQSREPLKVTITVFAKNRSQAENQIHHIVEILILKTKKIAQI
jgi:nicotinamide-nucleotide amidase